MSEEVAFRLHLAREMLRQGVTLSTDKLPIGRMAAVLALDHAMEMLLHIVVPQTGKVVGEQEMLPTLLKKLAEARPAFAARIEGLGRLHKLRNSVQHDGTVPSLESTHTMAVHAEVAFGEIGEQILGREIFERGALSLVRDAEVRKRLEDAEDKLAAGNPRDACIGAAIAFQVAEGRLISVLFPQGRGVWEGIVMELSEHIKKAAHEAVDQLPRRPVSSELSEFVERFGRRLGNTFGMGFHDPLTALYEPMALAEASIDFSELRRFRAVVPGVVLTLAGSYHARFQSTPDLDGARFAVEFATRTVLRLEAAISRLAGTTENADKDKQS